MNTHFLKLTETHDIKNFTCGTKKKDIDLTDFLLKEAKLYYKQKLGVTYLIENEYDTIAYCTILNDKIERIIPKSKNPLSQIKKYIFEQKKRR